MGAWSDVVANDLKQCNLSGAWREQAQQRDSWRATIKCSVELLNKQVEDKERSCKDESDDDSSILLTPRIHQE